MLNLKPIAANQTEVQIGNNTVLFSYKTPVAAWTPEGAIRTSKKWSVTTSRHINKWLAGAKAAEVDQSVLDNLI